MKTRAHAAQSATTPLARWSFGRRSIAGIKDIEQALARMLKSVVKYRFVIDMASLQS